MNRSRCAGCLGPVRPRDGPHPQGSVLPSASGLRPHDGDGARHAGAAPDGAGRARPLVVAERDDVGPPDRIIGAQRTVAGVEDQRCSPMNANCAPALRGSDRAAGALSRTDGSHQALKQRPVDRSLEDRPDRLGGVLRVSRAILPCATATACARACRRGRMALGCVMPYCARRERARRARRSKSHQLERRPEIDSYRGDRVEGMAVVGVHRSQHGPGARGNLHVPTRNSRSRM